MVKCIVKQTKTSSDRHHRERLIGNPLVAGSSPARPTSQLTVVRLMVYTYFG
jgi:hypothetical protein